MIIDYNDKEQMNAMGIKEANKYGRTYFNDTLLPEEYEREEEYESTTFRNFPIVVFQDLIFKNCIFENCQALEFSEGCVENCTFRNVSAIEGNCTDFSGCTFVQCCSQGPLLSAESIDRCTFDHITVCGEDG